MKVILQGFDVPPENEPTIQIVRQTGSVEVYYEGKLRFVLWETGSAQSYYQSGIRVGSR